MSPLNPDHARSEQVKQVCGVITGEKPAWNRRKDPIDCPFSHAAAMQRIANVCDSLSRSWKSPLFIWTDIP
jgi:hypothetical protein